MEPRAKREAWRGRLIRVEVESWPAGEREIVRHPGACAVVALTSTHDVLLVRQVREAVREKLLEIPAGILDVEGEDARACAIRELFEETGYRASNATPLATILTSPGFADERIAIFLAEAADEPEGVPEAGVEVVRLTLDGALEAVRDGRIADAKTVAGLLLAAEERSG